MATNEQIDKIIAGLSRRMGTPESEIRSALNSGSYDRLLSKLDDKRSRQLQDILSDEEQAKKFLSTPQAQSIMRKLMG